MEIWLLEEESFKSTPECWQWRHRNNVFRQCIPYSWSRNAEVRLPTVVSLNDGTTRWLVLAERSARRPGRSSSIKHHITSEQYHIHYHHSHLPSLHCCFTNNLWKSPTYEKLSMSMWLSKNLTQILRKTQDEVMQKLMKNLRWHYRYLMKMQNSRQVMSFEKPSVRGCYWSNILS